MIEIYLFVNPLGAVCLETEKDILRLIENEKKKIQLRCIPLVNMLTITKIMRRRNVDSADLTQRNRLFENNYAAALDFKALQLQGQKKGRHFLIALQEAVAVKQLPYTKALVEKLVAQLGGDLEMFQADRESSFVQESFQVDQQIAREMNIKHHPSAVIYNYACECEYGILIEDCQSTEEIKKLCDTSDETFQYFQENIAIKKYENRRISRHLHLL